MITLKLTSPNMKRPEVSAAQKLLKDKGYYTGKIDSIYVEASARATRSAKRILILIMMISFTRI